MNEIERLEKEISNLMWIVDIKSQKLERLLEDEKN